MNDDPSVITRKSGHVAEVVLNNPKRRNAMTFDMWGDLADAMDNLSDDDDIRVVVVRGAGEKAFCAGADISEFETWRTQPEKAKIYDAKAHRGTRALAHCAKPTVAAIRGACVGGGFELAVLCDIRVCAHEARFAVTPAKLGLGYDLEDTDTLVSRLGAPATREILFTGRMFDAQEALRLGIVNQVVAPDRLADAVDDYTGTIAANAPLTVRASKAIIAEAAKSPGDRDSDLCERLVRQCYASEDFAEGRAAFAEKRRPQFKGR